MLNHFLSNEPLKNKIKWEIVVLIDRFFHNRYCWADLVMWHCSLISFIEIKKPQHCGYCGYCGQLPLNELGGLHFQFSLRGWFPMRRLIEEVRSAFGWLMSDGRVSVEDL